MLLKIALNLSVYFLTGLALAGVLMTVQYHPGWETEWFVAGILMISACAGLLLGFINSD